MSDLNNVFEYVSQLSTLDEKGLMARVVKGMEELGELAKAVLPYEQQFAVTHRFPNKKDILEESCDTILCALSVPFSIGYTKEDIVEMLKVKADKWAELQTYSRKGAFPLPFEIHVTISSKGLNVDSFKDTCKTLNVKPIVLDLQLPSGGVIPDVMTSSVILTDNLGALTELNRIANGLLYAGFIVNREKIETVLKHPAAQGYIGKGYFESHFNCLINTKSEAEAVSSIADDFECHLSRNKFKINSNGSYNQMVTYRVSHDVGSDAFSNKVSLIAKELRTIVEVERVIEEYAIFDSKYDHDKDWLQK